MFRSCFSRPLLGLTMAMLVAGCTLSSSSLAESTEALAASPLLPATPFHSDTSYRMYNTLLAEMLVREAKLKQAAQHYILATVNSEDVGLLKRATEIALEADEPLLAKSALERWAKLEPNALKVRQYRILLNAQLGNYDATIEDVDWVRQSMDKSEGFGFEFVMQLLALETGQRNTYEVLQRYADKKDGSAPVQLAVATFALSSERYEEVLKAVDKVLAEGDDAQKKQAVRLRHRALLALGREEEALSALQALIKDTDDARLKLDYGRLLIMTDRREEARLIFQQLYADEPDNADVLYTLGLLYLEQGEYAFAEPLMKKLLKIPDRKHRASYFLGQIYEGQKRNEEALKAYEGALKGDLAREAMMRRALLLKNTLGLEAARSWLQEMAQKTDVPKEKIRALMAEGELLHNAGSYQQAVAIYTRAEALGVNKHNLLYARSLSYERMGKIAEAEQDLRAILAEASEDADSLNALGYMLTLSTDRYQEAYELIQKAIEINPESPAIMDSMGWVKFKLNDLAGAEEWLRKAFNILPDPEIASHLIEVLSVSGKQDEAKQLLQEMLSKHPEDKMLVDVKERLVGLSEHL